MYDVILFSPPTVRFHYIPGEERRLNLSRYQRASASHVIANEVRKHGYTALVIDFIDLWTWKEIKELLKHTMDPETVVGLSTTFSLKAYATEDIREIEEDSYIHDFSNRSIINKFFHLFKDNKLVVGGPNAQRYGMAFPEYVDHVVVGYGETQIIDLLNNRDNILYPKVLEHDIEAKNEHTNFHFETTPELWADTSLIQPNEPMHMEVARGCPFKCKFCRYFMIGRKEDSLQFKSKETLREMFMYNYENFGTTMYQFTDDTLNTSLDKLHHVNDVLQSLPFRIRFWCYIRCDLLMTQPEQIPLLKEMGLAATFMGIETFNRKAGRAVGKGSDPERIKDTLYAAKECWKGEVAISQGYLAGLPNETIDDINESIEWLTREDCPVDTCVMGALNITPIEVLQYRGQEFLASTFDREYANYGYEFPELQRHLKPNQNLTELFELPRWVKHDSTGLNDYHQVLELVQKEWQPRLNEKLTKLKYEITSDQNLWMGRQVDDIRQAYVLPTLAQCTTL